MSVTCFESSPLGVFHMEAENAIPQGASWQVSILYKENDAAVDLSSYTAKMQIRKDYDKEIILELSSPNTISLGSGSGDTPNVILLFRPQDTSPLTTYKGIYDLELLSPTGTILKFVEGRWELRREITK